MKSIGRSPDAEILYSAEGRLQTRLQMPGDVLRKMLYIDDFLLFCNDQLMFAEHSGDIGYASQLKRRIDKYEAYTFPDDELEEILDLMEFSEALERAYSEYISRRKQASS
ncbi:MAG: hypothetical protein J7K54_05035 [Candidatus Aenigmarchaeota archaeon]|nr:hypothetical protein [Candidatus Aenigmarchaeota archaeon]